MNRGVDRQTTFFGDPDRLEFGRLLGCVHERYGIETLAYCLMDNHYHLLLRSPVVELLSDAMQVLGSTYTCHTNERVGRDGPLFRGRFHSIPVETDEYFLWVGRYIHLNPLDLPGVTSAGAYRWSSYRTYLGLRPAPDFLSTDALLEHFDHDRSRLAAFTEADSGPGRRPAELRVPTAAPVRLGEILSVIRCALALDDVHRGTDADARQWRERTLLVLLAREVDDPALRGALVEYLAHPSAAAARMAVRRAERRLADDPVVGRALLRVDRYLGFPPAA